MIVPAYRIRISDGSEADLDALTSILCDAHRLLDPDFLEAGVDFYRDAWGRRLREPDTEWAFLDAPDGTPAGFAGWRLRPLQSHLHALFVAAPYQRRGYARALLHYHWEAPLRRQPTIQCFTLHVREPAYWARRLYESEGYQYYQPGDECSWPALQVWIDACQDYGNWPLPPVKLLMHRAASFLPTDPST